MTFDAVSDIEEAAPYLVITGKDAVFLIRLNIFLPFSFIPSTLM